MYGNYLNGPLMMPNMSYGPIINNGMRMASSIPYMARQSSLGNGLRSLLGIGGSSTGAARGILGATRGINWSTLLGNASKTLGVVNQAIPIVKEVRPMINNMKSMLKVASIFKDETDTNTNTNSNTKNTTTSSSDTIENNNYKNDTYNHNEPNFFI